MASFYWTDHGWVRDRDYRHGEHAVIHPPPEKDLAQLTRELAAAREEWDAAAARIDAIDQEVERLQNAIIRRVVTHPEEMQGGSDG